MVQKIREQISEMRAAEILTSSYGTVRIWLAYGKLSKHSNHVGKSAIALQWIACFFRERLNRAKFRPVTY